MPTMINPNVLPPTPYLGAGSVITSWCSKCNSATNHRYEPHGKVKLVCERCETNEKNRGVHA